MQHNDILQQITSATGDFLPRFITANREMLSSSDPLVSKMLEHLLKSNGKFIRPLLVALSNRLAGGDVSDKVVNAAVLIELLHNASLIHDDVIDNSPIRRGNATLNKLFGNHTAVLVGDYLLARGFLFAVTHCDAVIMQALAEAGMLISIGELHQDEVSRQNKVMNEEQYFRIIDRKTGALFKAATFFGGHLAGASDEEIASLTSLGSYIGSAFQIKDDLFDYLQQEDIGKPIGLDLAEGKVTLPLIYAYREASSEVRQEIETLLAKASSVEDARKALIAIAFAQGGVSKSLSYLEATLQKAEEVIRSFPSGEAHEALLQLCDFLYIRSY